MSVKDTVFQSKAERENFNKLMRTWSDKYRIYHNLPFLNVFEGRYYADLSDDSWAANLLFDRAVGDISRDKRKKFFLSDADYSRLKKTSIDYTLCDESDRPLVCVEFDGLCDGFNIGTSYRPGYPQENQWRSIITELKLKVAHGNLFPFVVVGSEHFRELDKSVKLTVVDAIIGEVLARMATRKRFRQGFDPEDAGYSQEDFDRLTAAEQQEIVQDWVTDIEVEEDIKNNPIHNVVCNLQRVLDVRKWSERHLDTPSIAAADSLKERAKAINNAVLHGAECTIHSTEFGDVSASAWLPNFKIPGYYLSGLAKDIAFLLALKKLESKSQKEGLRESLKESGI